MPKKPVIPIISGILALLFTVYIALDTFVITHVYKVVSPAAETVLQAAGGENEEEHAAAEVTDTSYKDENISITLTTYREYNTDIYVADVVVSSPEHLMTAFAQSAYGKNITDKTSNIAEENNAILAINGDYYGVQESGYVIRNGVLYRNTVKSGNEDLVIDSDGAMYSILEEEISAEQLLANGAVQVLSFGPALLKDGEIAVTESERVAKEMNSNPRTAIGMIEPLHYVFVVADGRTQKSEGLSLYEMAEFLQSLNVSFAYNLDGGGSSSMVFNGNIINNPTTMGSSGRQNGRGRGAQVTEATNEEKKRFERSVSDIVFIR